MKITNIRPKSWKDLQDEVCKFLNESGYLAESPKTIETARGTVEVDVYVESQLEIVKSFICECKNWNSPIPKEKIHALRTVTHDSGVTLGIMISKSGFQSGAYEAAKYSNILLKDWDGFIKLIEKQWIINQTIRMNKLSYPLTVYTNPSDTPFKKLSKSQQHKYWDLTHNRLAAYMKFRGLSSNMLSNKQIVVDNITFTALDKLFHYFEATFNETIKQYEKIFEKQPVEAWKLEYHDVGSMPDISNLLAYFD